MIPYGEFEAALLEVVPRDILKNERVVPFRITVTPDYGALTLRVMRLVRKKVTDAIRRQPTFQSE